MENKNIIENLSNGNSFEYECINGTYFMVKKNIQNQGWKTTGNDRVNRIISSLVHTDTRVRIWYGNTENGLAWNEEYDVMGRIGRTMGNIKIPILIAKSNSYGGPALLTERIIRIDDIKEKRTLYCHPDFNTGNLRVEAEEIYKGYPYSVFQDREEGGRVNVANFKTEEKAIKWIAFMNGDSYSK